MHISGWKVWNMKRLTLEQIQRKIINYQIVVMLSFIFGAMGFAYNSWRYEHNEQNNNIRIASFQILHELASLEQNIYANHYDHDRHKGSPRDGWVKVGLIGDLAPLISPECSTASQKLKSDWQKLWQKVADDRQATDILVQDIDRVKERAREVLRSLY